MKIKIRSALDSVSSPELTASAEGGFLSFMSQVTFVLLGQHFNLIFVLPIEKLKTQSFFI